MTINERKPFILLAEGLSIPPHFLWKDMRVAVDDHGGSAGDAALRLPFCETIVADTFSEIPIFVRTRTEDQREGLRDIDSIFLLLNLFPDMEGNDLPQKEIVTP
jgi:hypothetical protein